MITWYLLDSYYTSSGYHDSCSLFGSAGGQRAFGLGTGAGFLGGAMASAGAMSVYHRYQGPDSIGKIIH